MKKLNTLIIIFLLSITVSCSQELNEKVDLDTSKNMHQLRSNFSKEFEYRHIVDWEKGMKFMVWSGHGQVSNWMQNEVLHIFPYNIKRKGYHGDPLSLVEFHGQIFTFIQWEDVQWEEKKVFSHAIFENNDKLYGARFYQPIKELKENRKHTYIEHLVYYDEYEKVKEFLEGKELYILTSLRKYDESPAIHRSTQYSEIKITRVMMGDRRDPLKIYFTEKGKPEAYLQVYLSQINSSLEEQSSKPNLFDKYISFDKYFSFYNPKEDYPEISDENWKNIMNGNIVQGMTKNECLMSWGKPLEIKKNSENQEKWKYNRNADSPNKVASVEVYFTNEIIIKLEKNIFERGEITPAKFPDNYDKN